ncbi:MAG: hypothetical protein J2P36_11605 [Ktedonobacteraceae bacterium]|nr:hypothetical protein [Ktedonobacteraceae bacterium]
MKTQSRDTSPEAERVLVGMLRQASVARRFQATQSWSASLIEAGRLAVETTHPQVTATEAGLLYAQRHYGDAVVQDLRSLLHERRVSSALPSPDLLAILFELADLFERWQVPYALAGSLASSLYGMQRVAMQLDLLVALTSHHLSSLQKQLSPTFSFRSDDLAAAVQAGTSFALFHVASLFKVQIWLPNGQQGDLDMLHRANSLVLAEGYHSFPVLSPEDLLQLQLEAFKQSQDQADDLWYDLLGVLKVQGPTLHLQELKQRIIPLGLRDQLHQALVDAGIE